MDRFHIIGTIAPRDGHGETLVAIDTWARRADAIATASAFAPTAGNFGFDLVLVVDCHAPTNQQIVWISDEILNNALIRARRARPHGPDRVH